MRTAAPRAPYALTASWIGLGGFFLLVGLSAALYPGGHRFDERFPRFSLLYNFLCDLFAETAYNGQANPGRSLAVAGTYALAASLLLFWNLVPRLFAPGDRRGAWVRGFGTLAMGVSFLIATPLHDLCIVAAVPLGLVAFGTTLAALRRAGEAPLVRLGWISLLACGLNYLNFVFRLYPRTLPGVQKLALFFFLAWLVAALLRISATWARGVISPGPVSFPAPAPGRAPILR
jgi:hypothetical protein